MSMTNSNDTIGNRTRDLPTCSAVPQPTAQPGAPYDDGDNKIALQHCTRLPKYKELELGSMNLILKLAGLPKFTYRG